MRQRKTPAEKKALSYTKDRVLGVEYPKAFRNYWPRRKAAASQKERRQVRQLLDTITPRQQVDSQADFPTRPVKRDQVQKWPESSVALGEVVIHRHHMRVYRTAWNFFKKPYTSEEHRVGFVVFLEELIQHQTPYSQKVADLFLELLEPPEYTNSKYTSRMDRRSVWLHAFLSDEPTWRERLLDWINRSQL